METLETRGTTYRVYEYLEVCIHMGRCHGIPTHMTRFHTQNDSDTPPHSNSQWYTTYDMFERKTCLQNKIIKNWESKHLIIARTPPCLKALEKGISNNATDMTH